MRPRWFQEFLKERKSFPLAFVENRARYRKASRLRKNECAINYFLDGRVMYLSTLAPQLPEAPIEERIPVQYVIFVHQSGANDEPIVNKWQLGRLIVLLHHLGTVRLAALKDIKLLRDVGQKLFLIDNIIQDAHRHVHMESDEVTKFIRSAHEEYNEITRTFLTSAGAGILYRIERSRYYVKQFDTGKQRLRIRRLEGDQPYDQFVERRLGAQYDFIDRLGLRYERATTSISSLDQNHLSVKTARLSEKATILSEEARKIDKEIKSVQEWGEFFLLLFLAPYYVSHQAEMLVKEPFVAPLSLIIWAIFGTYAFWKKWRWEGMKVVTCLIIFLAAATYGLTLTSYKCDEYFRFCTLSSWFDGMHWVTTIFSHLGHS